MDFHVACEVGRVIETEPDTECIVLSADKGFDLLQAHLNKNGLSCRRVNVMADLVPRVEPVVEADNPERAVCPRCHKANTIEHY